MTPSKRKYFLFVFFSFYISPKANSNINGDYHKRLENNRDKPWFDKLAKRTQITDFF